jgi:FMN phosphatase YigB (HAD superfamily)
LNITEKDWHLDLYVSLLLERLELRGEEVVFLDDIGSNLSAARRAGISTIKVADVHTAIGELQVSFFLSYPPKSLPQKSVDTKTLN